jgi:hypothetical protein
VLAKAIAMASGMSFVVNCIDILQWIDDDNSARDADFRILRRAKGTTNCQLRKGVNVAGRCRVDSIRRRKQKIL